MGRQLILTLNVADDADLEDVFEVLNGDALPRLEDSGVLLPNDEGQLWAWIFPAEGPTCCSHLYESACDCCVGECADCGVSA